MDVTMKSGPLARQSHVQEVYGETTDAMEFGELFNQFSFQQGGSLDVNALVAPNRELTSGMEGPEAFESSEVSDQNETMPALARRQDSTQRDEVETASQLLSERVSNAEEHPTSDDGGKEQLKTLIGDGGEHAEDATEALKNIENLSVAHQNDLVDLQQLSNDQHQGIIEQRLLNGQNAVVDGNRKMEHRKGSGKPYTEGLDGHTNGLEVADKRGEVSNNAAQLINTKPTSGLAGPEQGIEIQGEPTVSEEPKPEFTKLKLQTTDPKNQSTAPTSTQRAEETLQAVGASMGGSAAHSAATQGKVELVQISSKGKTISNLPGLGEAKGKLKVRPELKAAPLDSLRKSSGDVELPEDVDKLAVVRQISDELKLKFGSNQKIEVNLNPAELGRVRIQLQMQSDQTVNVRVSAEHSMIADLLNLNLNDLRRDLLAQGVQVNQIEVDADAHGQSGYEGQEQEQTSEEKSSNQDDGQIGEEKSPGRLSVQA